MVNPINGSINVTTKVEMKEIKHRKHAQMQQLTYPIIFISLS